VLPKKKAFLRSSRILFLSTCPTMVNVIGTAPRALKRPDLCRASCLFWIRYGFCGRALRCFEVGRLACARLGEDAAALPQTPARSCRTTGGGGGRVSYYLVAGLVSQMAGAPAFQPAVPQGPVSIRYAPPEGLRYWALSENPFQGWEKDTRQSDWGAYRGG